MKLRAIWVGRTKNPHLAGLIKDYASRIGHFLPLDIVETKEPRGDGERRIEAEGEKLLAAIHSSDRLVILDPRGRTWTSDQFAGFVRKHMASDPRSLAFVVGGYGGLADEVKRRADVEWALSSLTFSHDLTRVVLMEQLYRALSIIHNLPYSK